MPSSSIAAASVPLSSGELAELRTMLEEQRVFRVDQLVQLRDPVTAGRLGGTDDAVVETLRAGAKAALHEVQAALWRMDEGRYGRCTVCGGPVERARLEILPQVARCMPCQRTDGS